MKLRSVLVLSFLLAPAGWVSPASPLTGPVATSLSMPVRGVWMHPGFFGSDKAVAIEKMRTTLDAYVQAGINTVIMSVKNTSG
ncbi:MAG: hypothetical protein IH583_12695, partial [Candidatus Aminicenantes bacterium]|nr:hypothetical protein [Candidatus Aminicenantes bacterium]